METALIGAVVATLGGIITSLLAMVISWLEIRRRRTILAAQAALEANVELERQRIVEATLQPHQGEQPAWPVHRRVFVTGAVLTAAELNELSQQTELVGQSGKRGQPADGRAAGTFNENRGAVSG